MLIISLDRNRELGDLVQIRDDEGRMNNIWLAEQIAKSLTDIEQKWESRLPHWTVDSENESLRARVAELEEERDRRRDLLRRTYEAACKRDWEEGECLNEVLSDIGWESIDVPKLEAEAAREAAAESEER